MLQGCCGWSDKGIYVTGDEERVATIDLSQIEYSRSVTLPVYVYQCSRTMLTESLVNDWTENPSKPDLYQVWVYPRLRISIQPDQSVVSFLQIGETTPWNRVFVDTTQFQFHCSCSQPASDACLTSCKLSSYLEGVLIFHCVGAVHVMRFPSLIHKWRPVEHKMLKSCLISILPSPICLLQDLKFSEALLSGRDHKLSHRSDEDLVSQNRQRRRTESSGKGHKVMSIFERSMSTDQYNDNENLGKFCSKINDVFYKCFLTGEYWKFKVILCHGSALWIN